MRINELIFHSIWTAFIGVLLIFAPTQAFGREIGVALGVLFLLPTAITLVALAGIRVGNLRAKRRAADAAGRSEESV